MPPVWFFGERSEPKNPPQNDVEQWLILEDKKSSLSLYHKWQKKFIDNIRPPSEFSGGVSTQKIHPPNDVERWLIILIYLLRFLERKIYT